MKLILFAVCGAALWAQPKEFEVASIHPSAPQAPGQMEIGMSIDQGMLRATGMTAKFLIEQAYDVRDFQVVGGPSWIGSQQYDINAKIEGNPTSEQMRTMMQSLLADRFQLQVHREKKEMPCYALVVAKGGSKLKAPEADADGKHKDGRMSMSRGSFTGQGLPVQAIAHAVEQVLGRAVIDKTGLTGNFDFKLEWTPDEARTDGDGASIFTALQEQLGLKLESTKGPVEIVVVDRLEKPSEN
ncbi:MAG TPA: TIGR03435 family protein [Bryobacteraceae bacterium]|nr:TIGR03435 family protein [Bryobacteraceae bacterium]